MYYVLPIFTLIFNSKGMFHTLRTLPSDLRLYPFSRASHSHRVIFQTLTNAAPTLVLVPLAIKHDQLHTFGLLLLSVTLAFENPFILKINGVPSDQKRSHEPFQPVEIVVSGPTIDPVLSLRTSDPLLV